MYALGWSIGVVLENGGVGYLCGRTRCWGSVVSFYLAYSCKMVWKIRDNGN